MTRGTSGGRTSERGSASDRRVRWLSWWGDVAGSGKSWWYTTARWLWRCAMAKRLITVNDILAGHLSLDVACLDRIYLNGYLPTVQVPGQVVQFLQHRGFPIPSPAVVEKMGTGFRDAVKTFAEVNHIPVVRFGKNDRKLSVMQPHLDRQAATGRAGVAAIGVAQEFGVPYRFRTPDLLGSEPEWRIVNAGATQEVHP